MYTKDKQLFLNGEASSEPALREKIRAELADNKEVQAIIGADTAVSHGEVIHLIDVVKQEGVVKFALNIETVARPPEAPTMEAVPVTP
jgi:biopolymer transport protein ExbD